MGTKNFSSDPCLWQGKNHPSLRIPYLSHFVHCQKLYPTQIQNKINHKQELFLSGQENIFCMQFTCSSSSISRILWVAAPPVKETSSATIKKTFLHEHTVAALWLQQNLNYSDLMGYSPSRWHQFSCVIFIEITLWMIATSMSTNTVLKLLRKLNVQHNPIWEWRVK